MNHPSMKQIEYEKKPKRRIIGHTILDEGITVIELPHDAEFICIDNHDDCITLCFVYHGSETIVHKNFVALGLGEIIPNGDYKYLGSIRVRRHPFNMTRHIFELL